MNFYHVGTERFEDQIYSRNAMEKHDSRCISNIEELVTYQLSIDLKLPNTPIRIAHREQVSLRLRIGEWVSLTFWLDNIVEEVSEFGVTLEEIVLLDINSLIIENRDRNNLKFRWEINLLLQGSLFENSDEGIIIQSSRIGGVVRSVQKIMFKRIDQESTVVHWYSLNEAQDT